MADRERADAHCVVQWLTDAGDWTDAHLGENPPRSRAECEADIGSLSLNSEWKSCTFRVQSIYDGDE